jgi:hypothetical protein
MGTYLIGEAVAGNLMPKITSEGVACSTNSPCYLPVMLLLLDV